MAILNKTGITTGGTIQAEHVTRTIDALTGVSTDTIIATGSFSGPLTGTASFATSASRAVSSSFATTASFALNAVGAGSEYMTLRLASGLITSVTSGSAVYVGTGVTASTVSHVGVEIPFACTVVSASVYVNTPSNINANLVNVAIRSDVTGANSELIAFTNLDIKTVRLDGNSAAVGSPLAANKWINLSYTPDATGTGAFVISADVLIKKS